MWTSFAYLVDAFFCLVRPCPMLACYNFWFVFESFLFTDQTKLNVSLPSGRGEQAASRPWLEDSGSCNQASLLPPRPATSAPSQAHLPILGTSFVTASASYRIENPRNPENWRKLATKRKNCFFVPIFLLFLPFCLLFLLFSGISGLFYSVAGRRGRNT